MIDGKLVRGPLNPITGLARLLRKKTMDEINKALLNTGVERINVLRQRQAELTPDETDQEKHISEVKSYIIQRKEVNSIERKLTIDEVDGMMKEYGERSLIPVMVRMQVKTELVVAGLMENGERPEITSDDIKNAIVNGDQFKAGAWNKANEIDGIQSYYPVKFDDPEFVAKDFTDWLKNTKIYREESTNGHHTLTQLAVFDRIDESGNAIYKFE